LPLSAGLHPVHDDAKVLLAESAKVFGTHGLRSREDFSDDLTGRIRDLVDSIKMLKAKL
jgi:hypothetical protein